MVFIFLCYTEVITLYQSLPNVTFTPAVFNSSAILSMTEHSFLLPSLLFLNTHPAMYNISKSCCLALSIFFCKPSGFSSLEAPQPLHVHIPTSCFSTPSYLLKSPKLLLKYFKQLHPSQLAELFRHLKIATFFMIKPSFTNFTNLLTT